MKPEEAAWIRNDRGTTFTAKFVAGIKLFAAGTVPHSVLDTHVVAVGKYACCARMVRIKEETINVPEEHATSQ